MFDLLGLMPIIYNITSCYAFVAIYLYHIGPNIDTTRTTKAHYYNTLYFLFSYTNKLISDIALHQN